MTRGRWRGEEDEAVRRVAPANGEAAGTSRGVEDDPDPGGDRGSGDRGG